MNDDSRLMPNRRDYRGILGIVALAAVIFAVYGFVLVSIFIGAVWAVQERYLPPWVVGLGVTAGVLFLLDGLGDPLGVWGLVLAVVSGMVAGGHYGLSLRRRESERALAVIEASGEPTADG